MVLWFLKINLKYRPVCRFFQKQKSDKIIASMPKKADKLKLREDGFNVRNLGAVKLKEYNALYDPNMRHYFENKKVQKLLYETGQIDKYGRVIDLEKVRSRINILEREFKEAESVEEGLQREELQMRYRIQRKRFNELEKTRHADILQKLKLERDLSREILTTMRAATGSTTPSSRVGNKNTKELNSNLFLTNGGGFLDGSTVN